MDEGPVDDEARPEDGGRGDGDLAEVDSLVAPPHGADPQAVVVGRAKVQDEAVLGGVGTEPHRQDDRQPSDALEVAPFPAAVAGRARVRFGKGKDCFLGK